MIQSTADFLPVLPESGHLGSSILYFHPPTITKKRKAPGYYWVYYFLSVFRAEQWRSFVAKLKYVYNVLFLKYSPLHASLCLKYKSVVCLTLCHRITGIACKFITKKEGVSIGLQHTTRDSMFLSAVAGIFPLQVSVQINPLQL